MLHWHPIDYPKESMGYRTCVPALLIVVCFAASSPSGFAGDSTSVVISGRHQAADDVAILLRDAGTFFTAPLRFNAREWLYTTGTAAGTALVMTADLDIKRRAGSSTDQSTPHDLWAVPKWYGAWEFAGAAATITYGTGLLTRDDGVRVTGRLLLESLALSGGSALIIRFIFGRSRPYGNNGQWDFNWFQASDTYQSFPSGHTVVAFSVSTVLAERIDNIWARIGFYGMATMTALERVHDNQHWASDVLAGAGLGLLGGFFVLGKERERTQSVAEPTGGLQIQPFFTGVRVAYRIY